MIILHLQWRSCCLTNRFQVAVRLFSRDFKNRGRGGSETRPEVIFPISDEERMRVAFSPELENAA